MSDETGNGEDNGAFVEIDKNKLTRDQIYMLGCKETLELWIEEFQQKAREHATKPMLCIFLHQVAERMQQSHDAMAVELTKSAVKSGSAVVRNAYGKKLN